jgi:hypothetical protein
MWQTIHAHTSPSQYSLRGTVHLPETEHVAFHLLTALTTLIFPSPRMRSNHIKALRCFRSSARFRPRKGVLQAAAVARSSPSSIRSPLAVDSAHMTPMIKSVDPVRVDVSDYRVKKSYKCQREAAKIWKIILGTSLRLHTGGISSIFGYRNHAGPARCSFQQTLAYTEDTTATRKTLSRAKPLVLLTCYYNAIHSLILPDLAVAGLLTSHHLASSSINCRPVSFRTCRRLGSR